MSDGKKVGERKSSTFRTHFMTLVNFIHSSLYLINEKRTHLCYLESGRRLMFLRMYGFVFFIKIVNIKNGCFKRFFAPY